MKNNRINMFKMNSSRLLIISLLLILFLPLVLADIDKPLHEYDNIANLDTQEFAKETGLKKVSFSTSGVTVDNANNIVLLNGNKIPISSLENKDVTFYDNRIVIKQGDQTIDIDLDNTDSKTGNIDLGKLDFEGSTVNIGNFKIDNPKYLKIKPRSNDEIEIFVSESLKINDLTILSQGDIPAGGSKFILVKRDNGNTGVTLASGDSAKVIHDFREKRMVSVLESTGSKYYAVSDSNTRKYGIDGKGKMSYTRGNTNKELFTDNNCYLKLNKVDEIETAVIGNYAGSNKPNNILGTYTEYVNNKPIRKIHTNKGSGMSIFFGAHSDTVFGAKMRILPKTDGNGDKIYLSQDSLSSEKHNVIIDANDKVLKITKGKYNVQKKRDIDILDKSSTEVYLGKAKVDMNQGKVIIDSKIDNAKISSESVTGTKNNPEEKKAETKLYVQNKLNLKNRYKEETGIDVDKIKPDNDKENLNDDKANLNDEGSLYDITELATPELLSAIIGIPEFLLENSGINPNNIDNINPENVIDLFGVDEKYLNLKVNSKEQSISEAFSDNSKILIKDGESNKDARKRVFKEAFGRDSKLDAADNIKLLDYLKDKSSSVSDAKDSMNHIISTLSSDTIPTVYEAQQASVNVPVKTSQSSAVSNTDWNLPLDVKRISSGYGWRKHPIYKDRRFHAGVDIPAIEGTPISSAGAGEVIHASRNGGYGNLVSIRHKNGYITRYAHCSKILVKKGDIVTASQEIAKVGSTGVSTGNHLHFEVRDTKGRSIDPLKYIKKVTAVKKPVVVSQVVNDNQVNKKT